ncbi:cytochrome P450 [Rhizobium sp. KAs_5_22]|uniref:cytochrome P450 n=1 Tax=Ciceribacter selenitireducens TaxID=448181 RepID=UPI00048F570B|nr:cytochrome P450 [Ciceribacter selenitireducens]PPJ46162.1 cytochrome P450 [Rhizobium sp. KAs_5_22]
MPISLGPTQGSVREVLEAHGDDASGYYQALRALGGERRLFFDPDMQAWVVTGHALCARLLASSALSKSRLRLDTPAVRERLGDLALSAQEIVGRQMSFDESESAGRSHHRWQRILTIDGRSAFRRALADMAAATFATFDAAAPDFYRMALRPYVSRAVAARLSLREAERAALYPLIYGYADFLDGKATTGSAAGAAASLALLGDYVGAHFDRLRGCDGQPIDDRERWIADYALTLVAGHESTAFALGTALGMLGDPAMRPGRASDLRAHLLEALRFDSPIQLIGRVARDDLDLGAGGRIRAGERVFLHVGAANRDPDRFATPDRFDPRRRGGGLLAFGLGASRCVGMNLALVEAEVFLAAALRFLGERRLCVHASSFEHGLAGRSFGGLALSL